MVSAAVLAFAGSLAFLSWWSRGVVGLLPRHTYRSTIRQPKLQSNFGVFASSIMEEEYDFSQEKNTTKLVLEAADLKIKAKSLAAEALAMEEELKNQRFHQQRSKQKEVDRCLKEWFAAKSSKEYITNSTILAARLEQRKASPGQILMVGERLLELEILALGLPCYLYTTTAHETTNLANTTQLERLSQQKRLLLEATSILDQKVNDAQSKNRIRGGNGRLEIELRSHLQQLERTQRLRAERHLVGSGKPSEAVQGTVESYVRKALTRNDSKTKASTNETDSNVNPINDKNDDNNNTNKDNEESTERVSLMPLWVPSIFLPFIIHAKSSDLGAEQVVALKDEILMGSPFYVLSYDSVPGAAIFRGNLRKGEEDDDKNATTASARAFATIQTRLQNHVNLRDRVQLFLLPDPEWKPDRLEPESQPNPVVLALSKDISPDESRIPKGVVLGAAKMLMYPLSIITTISYAISAFSLNEQVFYNVVNLQNSGYIWRLGLPILVGILGLNVLSEVAHALVAKWRSIRIGPPVPIPFASVGMAGCITPLKSFPSNRASLLDFALSGPLATVTASLACVVVGLMLTVRASPESLATFPVIQARGFKKSLLIGTLTSWIAPKTLMLPLSQPIPIHPLFVCGSSGLLASALNLLPIFRLDGGRACSAAMGSRSAAVISVSVLLFLLSVFLSGGTVLGFSWAIFATIFQKRQEIPARDDVTEVDNFRQGAWLFSFLLSIGILTPFPGGEGIF